MSNLHISFSRIGKVYLVGAGPGDPGLITVKGARCLQAADVVVYDRLVDRCQLDLVDSHSECISVGKKGGHYNFPQDEINQVLVARAQQGKQVVRLKGGDPFLFGRGGEEAIYLAQHKIPFEVIPGVSSALAVPAVIGVPVTHRQVASSVTIVAGHGAKHSPPLPWDRLATVSDTLVVLMPLQNLRYIVSQLVLHGRALDTPAALIQSGTWQDQQKVVATLRTIVSESDRVGIDSPALLVVGQVVQLAEQLSSCYQVLVSPACEGFVSSLLGMSTVKDP